VLQVTLITQIPMIPGSSHLLGYSRFTIDVSRFTFHVLTIHLPTYFVE
jgi:hypothetical protein